MGVAQLVCPKHSWLNHFGVDVKCFDTSTEKARNGFVLGPVTVSTASPPQHFLLVRQAKSRPEICCLFTLHTFCGLAHIIIHVNKRISPPLITLEASKLNVHQS